jgi:hypothetical protein
VHLVGFIIRKFVTMHGHMNAKSPYRNCIVTLISVSALNCYLKGFSLNWFTYKTMWTHCKLFEVRLMSAISGFIITGVYQLGEGIFLPCNRSIVRFILFQSRGLR